MVETEGEKAKHFNFEEFFKNRKAILKGKLIEVEKDISKLTPTCAVYDVTGENDVIVVSKFKSREEMSNFTKKLLSMTNVERTNSRLVLNTIKEDFRLSP